MPSEAKSQKQNLSLKRKQPPGAEQKPPGQQRKRQKLQDARTIAFQTPSKAFRDGELNVDKFIKAHEFEIRALEESMTRARKGLATRAFQAVPRDLRRRAASHNVKKVPKRLRTRVRKEMIADNTSTGAARRQKPTGKLRLRSDTAKRLKGLSSKTKAKQDGKAKPKSEAANSKASEQSQDPSHATSAKVAEQDERPNPNPNPTNIEVRAPKKKKNKLDAPPKPKAKFRKRQLNKTWLPTHLYHTKRARMTAPLEPLWRFALPLTPTAKSYRPTHRAYVERGAVAWDMSYVSTIGLEGTETALNGLFKAMRAGMHDDSGSYQERKARLWKAGTRTWEGWLFERNGWPSKGIAPVTVVWCVEAKDPDQTEPRERGTDANKTAKRKNTRKVFIRVHPAAFLQLWEELLVVAKVQKPVVSVEDLRFEIGSIGVTGPAATEALLGALWPSEPKKEKPDTLEQPEEVWTSLGGLTNPASLPLNALLGFNISDPRLHHPPRTISLAQSSEGQKKLLSTLATWPPDQTQSPPSLFDRTARLLASRSLPSQKAINRRKALAPPGVYPSSLPADPQIPILLLASRSPSVSAQQGGWTLLLPWKCVLPVWYSLMYYPLSTGGNVRFGGLTEKRQLAFEAGVPWFPGDFPGTRAGWVWEEDERVRRKKEWEKRPKGRRLEWESVSLGAGRKGELGVGWGCDWEILATGPSKKAAGEDELNGKGDSREDDAERVHGIPQVSKADDAKTENDDIHKTKAVGEGEKERDEKRREVRKENSPKPPIYHLPSSLASAAVSPSSQMSAEDLRNAVMTVKLTLLGRGVPETCSRIYRLPTYDASLRQKWLGLVPNAKGNKKPDASLFKTRTGTKQPSLPVESHEQLRDLAASLLEAPDTAVAQAGTEHYPEVPGEGDLIGFVTAGSFNLKDGKGTGIGNLLIGRMLEGREKEAGCRKEGKSELREERLCIVRAAGVSLGRLARWEIV